MTLLSNLCYKYQIVITIAVAAGIDSVPSDSELFGDLPDIENSSIESVGEMINQEPEIIENTSDHSDSQRKNGKSKRPKRLCPFCLKLRYKLSRHLRKKHHDNKNVNNAMKLPKIQRDKIFAKIRREGIVVFNKQQAANDIPKYQSERDNKKGKPLSRCSYCDVVVIKENYSRHRKKCAETTNDHVTSVPLSLLEVKEHDGYNPVFLDRIVAKFRNDSIGKICRTDKTILLIGSCFFWQLKGKRDKVFEVSRSVRQDMRRIAHCYNHFKVKKDVLHTHNNSHDMFNRRNFDFLASSIEEYTKSSTDEMKAGLKENLFYLIKRAAQVLQFYLFNQGKDEEAEEVGRFLVSWKGWKQYLFADASYKLNTNRQINLRKPQTLPLEEDLTKLREHVIKKMEELCSAFHYDDLQTYTELRNVAMTRLTLLNGRRGMCVVLQVLYCNYHLQLLLAKIAKINKLDSLSVL
ncbi:uncharacterized protein LOC130657748 [Hydractinia symbiolongicarpus]|uniref:uncharacterized protein LOC130657748 n=1 Tax=Hydractinia symbiolongicarpus TaxID=13093 RepID=UPI00254B99DE|nr:uncharacterized protein LOC130657748 [Hydractinia symbiolongicarpus]